MYEGWTVIRWETPVADIQRLYLVALSDSHRELTVLLEAARAPGRPRWRLRFRNYPAYRNIDEGYRTELWAWLDASGQRCGSTFVVQEPKPFVSWGTGDYLQAMKPGMRHFVVSTEDDVIEVLSAGEPQWEQAEPAQAEEPIPGKATHLYVGEDEAEIERLTQELTRKVPRNSGAG
jgi:hypothetical protein